MAQKRKDTSLAQQLDQFFLYTRLNENETKSLRKASTNKEEKRALSNIFNLQTSPTMQNQGKINKMDVLMLDYHYINFEFCKENHFSNEKVSTFLAIMDFILQYMLEKQIIPETGFKVLKQILEKHSLQRPPFSILIFEQSDIQKILQFTLKTFFRHYSLYEFAFKPRMELVLKFEPFLNNQFNTAELPKLEEMVVVEQEDADKLKVYLSLFNQQLDNLQLDQDPLGQPLVSDRHGMNNSTKHSQQAQDDLDQLQQEQAAEEQIDWKKVGKQYKPDDGIEAVLEREMNRLRFAMESKIAAQDIELEEKANAMKGKKK